MVHQSLWQAVPALALASCLLVVWRLSRIGRRLKDYPPGPPTLPIIGNLHQIPSERRYVKFGEWAKEYGPVYSLMLGTQVYVVLSADYAVRDLVDKRGPIYASRPDLYVAQHLISGGLRILWMEANEAWKFARKLSHRVLKIETARTYVPYQDLENKAMLLGMLEDPNDFIDHLRRYTASLTTQMTFGFRTTSIQDPNFKEAFEIFDATSELTATKPSICVDLVKMQKEEGFSDDFAAYISGSILQAGSETTSSILVGFVQAMVIFPEVAKKAQEEIDRVCGDRLPDLNDIRDLPYTRACMKESLRWMPLTPMGLPHATTQDDEYMGYRIPKNATIIMNNWAIHTDPTRYPSPRDFNPMRFWGDTANSADSANNPDVSKRDHFVFGAGRRRCLGMHIADRSMFLGISRLLWAFDFKRAIDPETKLEIIPDQDNLLDGVFILPKPFQADIRPRNAKKAERVREEWEGAKELLDGDGQWKAVPEGLIWRDYEPDV